jgi:hypothetical protein
MGLGCGLACCEALGSIPRTAKTNKNLKENDIIMYHKPHFFKVYDSVVANVLTELCNHYHTRTLEHVHHLSTNPYP